MVSNSEGIWRSGNLLVMQRDAELPDRCIKTNQPANGRRFKATLYWHHPAIYFVLLINLIVYLVVAIIVRKKATVYFGVTEETLRKRRRTILWSCSVGLAGIVLFFAAFSLQSESVMGTLVFLGFSLILGGLIGGIIKATLVRVARMEDEYIWLRGVNKDYLALLPEWNPGWNK
ncbi:MAG: hypothetical protein AAFW75_09065 [Cyanobacteria bacterium J06636_16]